MSGTATAGGLAVDLVSAIVTAGDFEFNQNAPKGKVVVHLELQATTTERYGDNFIGNHLAVETPNGEQATPLGGSNVVLAADAKASNLYADFAVPEPAMGKFVLVVRQQKSALRSRSRSLDCIRARASLTGSVGSTA